MNFYRRFVGDWLRDTTSLSMMQDGAYSRLVDVHFATEKGLPLDKKVVYRMARAVSRSERRAVDFVLKKFFQRGPGGYTQKRVLEELNYAKARISAARENGKRGGRPSPKQNPAGSPSEPSSNPTGLFTEPSGLPDGNPAGYPAKSYPDTRYQTPDALAGKRSLTRASRAEDSRSRSRSRASADSDPLFDEFWRLYPRKIRKRESLREWRKLLEAEQLRAVETLAAFKISDDWVKDGGQFVPGPQNFLRDKRFVNPPAPPQERKGKPHGRNLGIDSQRGTDFSGKATIVDL